MSNIKYYLTKMINLFSRKGTDYFKFPRNRFADLDYNTLIQSSERKICQSSEGEEIELILGEEAHCLSLIFPVALSDNGNVPSEIFEILEALNEIDNAVQDNMEKSANISLDKGGRHMFIYTPYYICKYDEYNWMIDYVANFENNEFRICLNKQNSQWQAFWNKPNGVLLWREQQKI